MLNKTNVKGVRPGGQWGIRGIDKQHGMYISVMNFQTKYKIRRSAKTVQRICVSTTTLSPRPQTFFLLIASGFKFYYHDGRRAERIRNAGKKSRCFFCFNVVAVFIVRTAEMSLKLERLQECTVKSADVVLPGAALWF